MTVRADVLRRELRAAYRASLVACTFESARELLRERPKNALARFRLGGALADFARYAEALPILRPLLRRGAPHRDLVHWCLADLYERRGMLPRAMHHLRCAIRIEPQEAGWHIRLGGLLARSGRHRAAENAHRRATRCARGPRDEDSDGKRPTQPHGRSAVAYLTWLSASWMRYSHHREAHWRGP